MEPEGVVTNTNPTNNINKNKLIVGGLVIGILILIGSMFLFGRKQEPAGPTPTLPPGIVLPTIDQAKETARTKVNISLTDNGFVPKIVTVQKGTRLIWFNKSGAEASVNSDNHPTHQLYRFLNLGTFPPNFSVQLVVEEPGTYSYHNHLKPEQTGTIIVQ